LPAAGRGCAAQIRTSRERIPLSCLRTRAIKRYSLPTLFEQGNTCGYDPTHAPNDDGVFGAYLDAMFSIIAHELTEWATNPDGQQWYQSSNGQENADLW
jgi:hypothetical protein